MNLLNQLSISKKLILGRFTIHIMGQMSFINVMELMFLEDIMCLDKIAILKKHF